LLNRIRLPSRQFPALPHLLFPLRMSGADLPGMLQATLLHSPPSGCLLRQLRSALLPAPAFLQVPADPRKSVSLSGDSTKGIPPVLQTGSDIPQQEEDS